MMLFWISVILLVSGIVAFAVNVTTAADPTTLWAMMTVNMLFFVGITQAGVVFSVIMRISKSGWGRYYSRLGEILTLAFIPVAVVMFAAVLIGGIDHLFYWLNPKLVHGQGELHLSPWLDKGFLVWRNILANAVFYLFSYIYFRMGRAEEKAGHNVSEALKTGLNFVGGLVCFFYVVANTFLAWDFGMTIIQHWESSIFAPLFWVGNLLAGIAYLYLMALIFIPRAPGEKLDSGLLSSMAQVIFGFILLWVYMFWSQYIVMWYGNLPYRAGPVFKQMMGPYGPVFKLLLLTLFIIPFLALLFRRVKRSATALAVLGVLICVGMWINRYLMIVPVYSDIPLLADGTGIILSLAALSATVLSFIVFRRVFPGVTLTTGVRRSGH